MPIHVSAPENRARSFMKITVVFRLLNLIHENNQSQNIRKRMWDAVKSARLELLLTLSKASNIPADFCKYGGFGKWKGRS